MTTKKDLSQMTCTEYIHTMDVLMSVLHDETEHYNLLINADEGLPDNRNVALIYLNKLADHRLYALRYCEEMLPLMATLRQRSEKRFKDLSLLVNELFEIFMKSIDEIEKRVESIHETYVVPTQHQHPQN